MVFTDALRAGFVAVRRSKRILLCAALTTALASLPLAVWVGRQVHDAGARRPDAIELARHMDPDFFADVRRANPGFEGDAAALVVVALVLMFAVRPFLWGGYAGIAAAKRRLSFAKFVREGGGVYWKFLRISAVGLLLLLGVALCLKPLLETFADWARSTPSEDLARSRIWVAELLAFAALCLVPMVLDYARVGVRMHRSPGILAELGRSALFVAQHPFRTTGLYLVGLALELAVCGPLFLLVRWVDGAYVGTMIAVLVLGQLLVAVREATRLFHIAGAWVIRAAEDRPASPEDAREEADARELLEERLPWHVG